MLSAETAIGAFPIEAADAAIRIVAAAETGRQRVAAAGVEPQLSVPDDARSIANAAVSLAHENRDVEVIACFTRSGRTARLIAAARPRARIFAFSPDAAVRRGLALVYGVEPRPIDDVARSDVAAALATATASIEASPGAAIVLVATTAGGRGGPNLIELLRRAP
jgi:pyruvate kinase